MTYEEKLMKINAIYMNYTQIRKNILDSSEIFSAE